MKVAILTQPLHTNYGGTLQAFALQYVIKSLGHEPETINYRKQLPNTSLIRKILSRIKQKIISGRIIYSFDHDEMKIISKYHDEFINKYIKYSDVVYDVGALKSKIISGGFHSIVVGSDQTWRPRYSPRIDSFFLDFLQGDESIKKISYASSFGTDVWEFDQIQTNKFKLLLKQFHFVSVREKSAVKLCMDKFDVQAEHVLDPTLLLEKDIYMNLLSAKPTEHKKNGIFNYVLDKSLEKKDIIKKCAKILQMPVFSSYPLSTHKESCTIEDFNDYIYPPIEEWISSFYYADYVITDSFHGTVFSIIFNKPFISVANEYRGKARFISLLELFGLEDRLVSNSNDINSTLLFSPINFEEVNLRLVELRKNSIHLLQMSLLN